MWTIRNILFTFLMLFFVDMSSSLKPTFTIEPEKAHNLGTVNFTCTYETENTTLKYIIIMEKDKNLIVLSWNAKEDVIKIEEQYKPRVGSYDAFPPIKGVLKSHMEVTLCDKKKYICRVYHEAGIEESDEVNLEFDEPLVNTSLKNDDGDDLEQIILKNKTNPSSYDFSCTYDNMPNAKEAKITSESTNLDIVQKNKDNQFNDKECRANGYANARLTFKDYGLHKIICTVTTENDNIFYTKEKSVKVITVQEANELTGESACGSSCVGGVVIGLLLVIIIIVAFVVYKKKLFFKFKQERLGDNSHSQPRARKSFNKEDISHPDVP